MRLCSIQKANIQSHLYIVKVLPPLQFYDRLSELHSEYTPVASGFLPSIPHKRILRIYRLSRS